MPIVQQGSINTTALVVPDLYVQIVPPQNLVLNGVPTNVVGIVGTASWGPVGHPVIVATMADFAQSFGPVMARKYDMGTQVATAVQQGAQNFRCVRVTDNTDSAAQTILPATTVTFTALYTGSLGNLVVLTLSTGSRASTWRLTVSLPGLQPEVYDNIAGTGALFWSTLPRPLTRGKGHSAVPRSSSSPAQVAPRLRRAHSPSHLVRQPPARTERPMSQPRDSSASIYRRAPACTRCAVKAVGCHAGRCRRSELLDDAGRVRA